MASNTSVRDIAILCKRLGDIQKARKAESELSYYRFHGELPEDACIIAGIRKVNGKEEIELKEGA